jgi:hypothetical protein
MLSGPYPIPGTSRSLTVIIALGVSVLVSSLFDIPQRIRHNLL